MKITCLFITLCCVCLCSVYGFSNTTKEVFVKYPNPTFVETGTFIGDGVQMAIEAGFKQVHSIELAPYYYTYSQQRFADKKMVHIWQGDSAKMLHQVINPIATPITFWLDGHCSMGDTAKGDTMTPLFQELEWIKQHPIKTHTILIDDIRCLGTSDFDFLTLEEVITKLKEINPGYQITFEDGHVKNDVLVAFIPQDNKRSAIPAGLMTPGSVAPFGARSPGANLCHPIWGSGIFGLAGIAEKR